jgi:hypothetical protein
MLKRVVRLLGISALYFPAMPWPLEQLVKEWAVIKQAPLSFFIVLFLCMALAFFVVRWIYRDHIARKDDIISDLQKKIGIQPQGASESIPSKAECPDKWLHEIAKNHLEEIGRYVLVEEVTAGINSGSPTPCVKFRIEYYNASIYTISIDPKFSGSISYGNRRLTQPIEVLTVYRLDNLWAGYRTTLEFYQWLTKEELDFILNESNAPSFDLSQLIITIIGSTDKANITPQPLQFGLKRTVARK